MKEIGIDISIDPDTKAQLLLLRRFLLVEGLDVPMFTTELTGRYTELKETGYDGRKAGTLVS